MSTWILLRGLTRESAHWGDFVPLLAQRLTEARLFTPDLPGNGRLHLQPSPTSVAAMTEACRAELRAQGVAPPYHLLAMSLGGMVAADWAQRHPQELARCVLINTSLRGINPWYQRLRPANVGKLLRLSLAWRQPPLAEAIVLRLTSRLRQADHALLGQWAAIRQQRPVSAANALRQLLAAMRYRVADTPPAAAVLVLVSAGDGLVDPRCSWRLAARWRTPLAEHPQAGHDLPLDDGPWVADQIARWMERG